MKKEYDFSKMKEIKNPYAGRKKTHSETLAQPNGPMVRVFAVQSLVAKDVVVTGKNALAILSAGDVKIDGTFAASVKGQLRGAGAHVDGNCNATRSR